MDETTNKTIETEQAPIPGNLSPEDQIKEALRAVSDPEIGLNVIQLGLIREIILDQDEPEIKMMLTTPFCPYGPAMLEMTRQKAETVLNVPTHMDLDMGMWDFSMMEDPSALDWGMYA